MQLGRNPNRKGQYKKVGKDQKNIVLASPGLEPETFSVLDWRDNQLHHETKLHFVDNIYF